MADPCCNERAEIEVLKSEMENIKGEHKSFRKDLHGVREKASVASAIVITLQGEDHGKRISIVEEWRKQFEKSFTQFVVDQKENHQNIVNELKSIVKNQNKIFAIGGAIVIVIEVISKFVK